MATKKRRALGPRIQIEFGTTGRAKGRTGSKKGVIRVVETTVKQFGLKQASDAVLFRKGKNGREIAVRGEVGAKQIKVPTGKKVKSKGGRTYDQLASIPVPGSATIKQIRDFVKKLKGSPKFFVSPGGRRYSVGTTKGR